MRVPEHFPICGIFVVFSWYFCVVNFCVTILWYFCVGLLVAGEGGYIASLAYDNGMGPR